MRTPWILAISIGAMLGTTPSLGRLPPTKPQSAAPPVVYAGIQVRITEPDAAGDQTLTLRSIDREIHLAAWIGLASQLLDEPIFVDVEILENRLIVEPAEFTMDPAAFGDTFDRILQQLGLARQKVGVVTCILYLPSTQHRPQRYSHAWFPLEETPFHTAFGLWGGLIETGRQLDLPARDDGEPGLEEQSRWDHVLPQLTALRANKSLFMDRVVATAAAISSAGSAATGADTVVYRAPEAPAPVLVIDLNPQGADEDRERHDRQVPVLHMVAGSVDDSQTGDKGDVLATTTAAGPRSLPDGISRAFLESALALTFHRRWKTPNGIEFQHALEAPPAGALDDVPTVDRSRLGEWRGRFTPIHTTFTSEVLPLGLLATAIAHAAPPATWRSVKVADGAVAVMMEGDRTWRIDHALRDAERWFTE